MRQFNELIKRHLAKQERDDFRAGLICAVLANIHRNEKRRRQPYAPADFMPAYTSGKTVYKKQTAEEMFHIVKLLNAAYGGEEV